MNRLVAGLGAVVALAAVLVGPARAEDVPQQVSASTAVAVGGSPVVGSSLQVVPADWSSVPDTRTYEWLRDGEGDVLGRDAAYALTPADAGHTMVVVERVRFGTRQDETSSTPVAVAAAQTAPAPPAAVTLTVNTRRPTTKGTARVGTRLAIRSKGAWTPRPTGYSYRWLRNGRSIKGATRSSYRLTAKDRRKKISVRVSARRPGVPTVTATSRATRRVR